MATVEQLAAALDRIADADPEQIKARLAQLEHADPGISVRFQAAISYLADREARPFWGALLDGYRPTEGGPG